MRKALILGLVFLPLGLRAQEVYVSDEGDGVSVLDAAHMSRVAHLDVGGKGPRGIAVTHDGKWLLTANRDSNDLSIIARDTGQLKARIPIGPSTEMVRATDDMAYVTYEPPGDKGGFAHVAVVDLARRRVIADFPSGHETEGLELSLDGKFLLVANEADDTVRVYGIPGYRLVNVVRTGAYGSRPRGIKRLPGGQGYIVTLESSAKFIVLNSQFHIVKEVATAQGPYGVAFSPDGKRIIIAAARAGLLQAFDAQTFNHIADGDVGKRCWHFAFIDDGRRIVAACGRSNALFVMDAASLRRISTLRGFAIPWGVVTYPVASSSLDGP